MGTAGGKASRLVLFAAALALTASVVPAAGAGTGVETGLGPAIGVEGCSAAVLPTASPIGSTSCPGVRPGAFLINPSRNAGCTMGFVLMDRYQRYYVQTAGHCAVDEGDRALWAEGKGPVVTDSAGKPFGRFVFAAYHGSYDVGIILVTKGIVPNPAQCHFGGPTGVTKSTTTATVILEHYGNGDGVSLAAPARTGVAKGMPDPVFVYALMAIMTGDSGGPVVMAESGRAVGYITHIGYGFVIGGGSVHTGHAIVRRLSPQIAYAQRYLKRTLSLRTARHSAPAV